MNKKKGKKRNRTNASNVSNVRSISSAKSLSRDGLTNILSGLGVGKSKRDANFWTYGLLNDWQQLDACYQENWIARQVVDLVAQDMTREWRRIKSGGAEDVERIEAFLTIPSFTQQAISWARLFGGSGMLMLTGQDLGKPLNLKRVKKGDLQRVIVFDRWEMGSLTLNTWDVLAPNYLQPEFYVIQGGNQEIHYTHFALFYGEQLPRRQLAQTQGWGDSVLRKCLSSINDVQAAIEGIAELMQESNIDVIKRQGLTEDIASDQDQAIIKRYELFSMMKSVVNLALLDGEEEFERKTLSLSGVAPAIEQLMTWVSGACAIPVSKLFGTSAKGMNATGEGDMRNYYDMVRALQNGSLAVTLRTLDEVLVRSATGSMPEDFDYIWNPLEQVNDVETAQAELLQADKNVKYYETGLVTKSQIQRQLQSTEQYQFQDEQIEELESLEEVNLFEEPFEGDPAENEPPTKAGTPKAQNIEEEGGTAKEDIAQRLSI